MLLVLGADDFDQTRQKDEVELSEVDYVDLLSDDDEEWHDAHDKNEDLAKSEVSYAFDAQPSAINYVNRPELVANDASD